MYKRQTVTSDLLDVKDFDYYSNITFDIAVPSINEIVLSGGRYDNLIGKYGKNLPAIGFGINTLPFLKKVKHAGFGIPVVSIDHAGSNDFETIFRLRDFFSLQGFVTIVSKSKHKVGFDLKIKVSSNGSLKLFNKNNKQLGSFKNLSELQKEDL